MTKTLVTVSLAISCGAATNVSATTAQVPQAVYGGEINVGIFDTLPGFCVGNNPANSALLASRSIYETLFEKSRSGLVVGLLAEERNHGSLEQLLVFTLYDQEACRYRNIDTAQWQISTHSKQLGN